MKYVVRLKDRLWRKTMSKVRGSQCQGADANRNFDFNWQRESATVLYSESQQRAADSSGEMHFLLRAKSVEILSTVETSCPTNPQQIAVMEFRGLQF